MIKEMTEKRKSVSNDPFTETTTTKVVEELIKLQSEYQKKGDIKTMEAFAYLVSVSMQMNKKHHRGNYEYRGTEQ